MRIHVTFLCIVAVFANAQTASRPPKKARSIHSSTLTTNNVTSMEELIRSFVAKKQFMGAVLVARQGNILLNKGYGFANLEWNIPNSPKTKFHLASVTKQFTAASILLLQERGKLNVNDPVRKYMPDAPAAWDKITIFNLLTHTSGIPDFIGFPDFASLEPFATTPQQLVARFRDKPLEFQPGDDWNYSNSGYILLGYLIEKISGEKYEQFVRENIFEPLGMADSGYDSNSAIIQNRATGYTPELKIDRYSVVSTHRLVNARYINWTIPFAAGGLYSTTQDLLRWEQGLLGGKLLSSASLKEMLTPFKHDYAFGLVVHTVDGHQVIGYGGRGPGFDTALTYYPEDELTVVVLANTDVDSAPEIAADLGTLASGQALPNSR